LDVRILGPLEVWEGAREVPIGGGRQRALFAILLLRANEVVSADRLIDELWGDAPPPTAGKALQGLVSQLRRALDGGLEIITRAPGYVLRVESDALDVNRLERLIAQGRNALADGDPAAAAVSLRQALGCGGDRRSPSSPSTDSRRPRSGASRSCG
jgi:DNA-binding SARP family transcriptional activator